MGGAGLFLAIVSGLLIFGVVAEALERRADEEEAEDLRQLKRELRRHP